MARFIGGPFDGKEMTTRYDHLPVLALYHETMGGHLNKDIKKFVVYYELRRGVRYYTHTKDYPAPGR